MELPLLFAAGSFVPLEDMTITQMEKFITFLVRCSYGIDQEVEEPGTFREPAWWLPNLYFVYPFKRPSKITNKWKGILTRLILRCYKYHNLEILLELSRLFANYQRNGQLRFEFHTNIVRVYRGDELAVTMRYANFSYDTIKNEVEKEVQSKECNLKLERIRTGFGDHINPKILNELDADIDQDVFTQTDFLKYLKLYNNADSNDSTEPVRNDNTVNSRLTLQNTTNIPFSSLLGRRLAKKVKSSIYEQSYLKKLERLDKYLNVPSDNVIENIDEIDNYKCVKRKSEWIHEYRFTKKLKIVLSQRTLFLYTKCKPCEVKVVPLEYTDCIHFIKKNKTNSDSNVELQVKLDC